MTSPLWKRIPALYNKHGSLKAVWRTGKYGGWHKVQGAYRKAVEEGLIEHVALGAKPHTHKKPVTERTKALKTKKARARRYILTGAQNNTLVHAATWENIKALAAHYDAEIYVSTFLYGGRSHWQSNLDKRAKDGTDERDPVWYDPAIVPYINNNRVEIASGLVWCGELNISPTAENPLSSIEVYTGRASMIVPHTHLAMESIATVGGSGTKFNYTTGVVTLRNYIQRKAGFKAEFHHTFGGLLVETDDKGRWWVRQLVADSEGVIHDLDVKVAEGKVTTGHRVEAITFGDVHVAQMHRVNAEVAWGKGGMVDHLRPRFMFIHDVLDFYSRSHHRLKDPYAMFERFTNGTDDVHAEVVRVMDFLSWIKRPDCQTVIVDSNHDRHLDRWMVENDGRKDPPNAKYWSWLNHQIIDWIDRNGFRPDVLALAINAERPSFAHSENVFFLPRKSSFVVCPKFGGGIECGLHFDEGVGGSRGNAKSFAKMGRRSNGGHSHVARWVGGACQAGTHSEFDLEYMGALNACSCTDIIVHENGKRQMVTTYEGKYKA